MASQLFFLECLNPDCGFRFPLDLSKFEGKVCPLCGAELQKVVPQIGQWQPKWSSPADIHFVGVLDNIRSVHNVGSIFRTSESAGLCQLYLCGLTPSPEKNNALSKSALGAEERVAWSAHTNAVRVIEQLKNEGYQVIALECLEEAENLFSLQQTSKPPAKVALVVGSEPAGVDPGILAIADQTLYIPMAGQKTSLNVAVAFGIAVYSLMSSWSFGSTR